LNINTWKVRPQLDLSSSARGGQIPTEINTLFSKGPISFFNCLSRIMSSYSSLFFGGFILSTVFPSALAGYTCTNSAASYGGIGNIRETCAYAGLQLMTDVDNVFPNDTISLPALGANAKYSFDVKQDFCHVTYSPTNPASAVTAETVPMGSFYEAVGNLTGSCIFGSQTFGSGQWMVTVGVENHVGKRYSGKGSAERSAERAELMALKTASPGTLRVFDCLSVCAVLTVLLLDVQKRDPSNRGSQLQTPGIGTLFRLTIGFVKNWFNVAFPAYVDSESATIANLANDLWNQLNAHLMDAGPPLKADLNGYRYQVTMEVSQN
jgi:hypothetical protein